MLFRSFSLCSDGMDLIVDQAIKVVCKYNKYIFISKQIVTVFIPCIFNLQ